MTVESDDRPNASATRLATALQRINGEQLLSAFKWFTVCLMSGMAFAERRWFNPDLISYLDVGDAWLHGTFLQAATGYWNPTLPIILSAMASLFPNNEWDPVAGHLANLFLHFAALAMFHWLLRQIHEFIAGAASPPAPINRRLVIFAYPAFIWCDLVLSTQKYISADILVDIALLAAVGVAFRIINRGGTLKRFAGLGLVLGLAFLSKVVMLSISLVFIATVTLLIRVSWRQLAYGVVALLVFAAVNAPYVALISKKLGHLSLGETGPLAYAWYVNDVSPLFHWTGEPPGFGTPIHPPRKLLDRPEVFDYTDYLHGTYSPGFDPPYWNEGLKPHPNWADQKRALRRGLKDYLRIFIAPGFLLLVAAIGVGLAQARPREFFRSFRWTAPLLLPVTVALAGYLVVLVDNRYVAYFLLAGYLAIVAPLLKSIGTRTLPVASGLSLASLIFVLITSGSTAYSGMFGRDAAFAASHRQVAQALKTHGLKPGDPIAIFGRAAEATYARMAEVQIVAEGCTFHSSDAWLNDPAMRERALDALKNVPVKAIVIEAAPANLETNRWIRVEGTSFAIHFRDDR